MRRACEHCRFTSAVRKRTRLTLLITSLPSFRFVSSESELIVVASPRGSSIGMSKTWVSDTRTSNQERLSSTAKSSDPTVQRKVNMTDESPSSVHLIRVIWTNLSCPSRLDRRNNKKGVKRTYKETKVQYVAI